MFHVRSEKLQLIDLLIDWLILTACQPIQDNLMPRN